MYTNIFRLQYFDLRDDNGHNNLSPEEMQDMWIPKLVFDNTELKPTTVADEESSGTIKVNIINPLME